MKNRRGLLYKATKSINKNKKIQSREFYKLIKREKQAQIKEIRRQKKTKRLKKVGIFFFKLKYTLFWLVILLFLSGIMGLIITILFHIIKI